MPLPLIIGAIAGAAATLGAGAGIYGASKIMEANEIKESAQKRKEKAVKLYKDKESELTALLDPLGKNELEIVKSFAEFSDIIEKFQISPILMYILRKMEYLTLKFKNWRSKSERFINLGRHCFS